MTAEELKRLRGYARLTQEELAYHVGVSRVTLARWEIGSHPITRSAAKLIRLICDDGVFPRKD